ncbi:MAG: DUF421 domain-containing protein [Bacteriovorax sp.]
MWQLNTPWYDPVIRAFVVYLLLFLIARLMGKKQLKKLSPFDLVLLLITGQVLQKSLIGEDQGIFEAFITIFVLIGLNMLVNELTHRFAQFEKLIVGQPEVIILNGKIHRRVMKREKISETELFEALREHEIMKCEDVKCAILETDGKISVIKYAH